MAQRYVLLIVAAMLASLVLALQPQNDLETIRERLVEAVLEESTRSDDPEEQMGGGLHLSSLTDQRLWPDIDYTSQSRSVWPTARHLERVRDMAVALRSPGASRAERNRLLRGIEASLGYWLERDFQSRNWWWNEIGIPRLMSRILLLAGDDLAKEQTASVIKVLARSTLKGSGQNLVWQAENNLVRGLFQQDDALVREALGAVAKTITTTRNEGIKPDLSFHQHGAILYSGGYGLGYSIDTARLAYITSGTRFAFPERQVDLLARYILDGQQWMTYGDVFDYTAVGREIARKNKNARLLARACDFMAQVKPDRAAEFQAFARRLRREVGPAVGAPNGFRHFWSSDYSLYRSDDFHFSVKTVSDRTIGTESGNGEGLQNYHLADGVTLIYRTGDEYRDIFPVWDWRSLPGVTCGRASGPLPELRWGKGAQGTTSFVGGVSDGDEGLSAFEYDRDGVTARKSWFFAAGSALCLGAGINSVTDRRIHTTVNQAFLQGPVTVTAAGDVAQVAHGERILDSPAWIHHAGLAYVFKPGQTIALRNSERTGSWAAVNTDYTGAPPVTHDVFLLRIEHERRPKNATYAYLVTPVNQASDSEIMKKWNEATIVANKRTQQAVWWPGRRLLQAAFYAPGSVTVPDGPIVSVDRPCLLMIRESGDREVTFAVADPRAQTGDVRIAVNRELSGEGAVSTPGKSATQVVVRLPGGPEAGKSTLISLTAR